MFAVLHATRTYAVSSSVLFSRQHMWNREVPRFSGAAAASGQGRLLGSGVGSGVESASGALVFKACGVQHYYIQALLQNPKKPYPSICARGPPSRFAA